MKIKLFPDSRKKFDIIDDTDYSDEAYLHIFANRKNKLFSFLQNDDPVCKSKLFDDALSFSKLDVFFVLQTQILLCLFGEYKRAQKA